MTTKTDEINTDAEADDLPIMVDDDQEQGADAAQVEDAAEDSGADDDFSDDDLSMLTEEERAAVLASDDDADDCESEAGADDAQAQAQGAAEGNADDGAAQAPATETTPSATNEVPETAPKTESQQPDITGALDALTAEANTARDTAFAAYEDGEITADEYKAQLAQIDRDLTSRAANIRDVAQFEDVKTRFMGEASRYLTEVPQLREEAHIQGFDRHVRAVTGNPDLQHLTHRQMLEAAHRMYLAEAEILGRAGMPQVPGAKVPPQPKPAQQAPEAQKPALAPKPEVVPTLARVPAAAVTEVSGGKYGALQAAIETADAEELERLMGKLTDQEREEFASLDI